MQALQRCLTLAWIIGLGMPLPGRGATTWYVSTLGQDGADGTNWPTALRTISNALDQSLTDDMILVSNGVYFLEAELAVSKGVRLVGAAGTEQTSIDGKASVRCLNISHSNAVVTGFTISNGSANSAVYGGGVYISAGMLRDCRVKENVGLHGGGVCLNGPLARVERCSIFNNLSERDTSYGGGGVLIRESGALIECSIISNRCPNYGGGVFVEQNGFISNCVIFANAGLYGGGIHLKMEGVVANSTIACNAATNQGGGMYCYYGAAASGEAVIENCRIISNLVTRAGYYYGGGLYIRGDACRIVLRNNVFAYNSAPYGGGIYCAAQNRDNGNSLANCTIVSNAATTSGGGLYIGVTTAEVSGVHAVNCVIYNNAAGLQSNLNLSGAALTGGVVYSCSYPASEMGSGEGNITSPPLFSDESFRLDAQSPGVNAGTNMDWMTGAVDLAGFVRRDRFSGIVDMGAYETIPRGALFKLR